MSKYTLTIDDIKKQAKFGAIVTKDMSGESQLDDQYMQTSPRPPLEFGREHEKFVEKMLATLNKEGVDIISAEKLGLDYIKKQAKIGVIVIKDTSGGSHQNGQRTETFPRPPLEYADKEAHGRFAEKVLATRYK